MFNVRLGGQRASECWFGFNLGGVSRGVVLIHGGRGLGLDGGMMCIEGLVALLREDSAVE